MFYSYVNEKEEEDIKWESVNDYRDDDHPLNVIEEQPVETIVNDLVKTTDPAYIKWQIFDEIPERVNIIECESYIDKNWNQLTDEKVDIDAKLEYYDENGEIDYMDNDDYYYCMNYWWKNLSFFR